MTTPPTKLKSREELLEIVKKFDVMDKTLTNVKVALLQQLQEETVRCCAEVAENRKLTAVPGDLIEEAIPILNDALNYFCPSKATDGDAACAARQRLFELRDRMEKNKQNDYETETPPTFP